MLKSGNYRIDESLPLSDRNNTILAKNEDKISEEKVKMIRNQNKLSSLKNENGLDLSREKKVIDIKKNLMNDPAFEDIDI